MTESARDEQLDHEELLAKLSLEDKVSLLTGVDYWHLEHTPASASARSAPPTGRPGSADHAGTNGTSP
jgi:hypothetical protein